MYSNFSKKSKIRLTKNILTSLTKNIKVRKMCWQLYKKQEITKNVLQIYEKIEKNEIHANEFSKNLEKTKNVSKKLIIKTNVPSNFTKKIENSENKPTNFPKY